MNNNLKVSVQLLDVNKMKLDGRINVPKRRSSKSTGGEKDENAPQLDMANSSMAVLDSVENIAKSNTWEPKLNKEEPHDIRHLKELLMLNLDLVNKQQDLLKMKEEQISQFKADNQALRCRLERMERRMSLLKGGKETATGGESEVNGDRTALKRRGPSLPPQSVKKFATDLSNKPRPRIRARDSARHGNYFVRNRHRHRLTLTRRKGPAVTQRPREVERESRELRRSSATVAAQEPRDASLSPAPPAPRHSEVSQSTTPGKRRVAWEPQEATPGRRGAGGTPHGRGTPGKQGTGKVGRPPGRPPATPRNAGTHSNIITKPREADILKTNTCYYVTGLNYESPEAKPVKPEVKEPEEAENQVVLVPTFRIKKFCPYYVIEGTENFDDEVYAKRHQKHELEEKKRKRWDLQRQRELEQLHKLQHKTARNGGTPRANDDDSDDDTFLPDPDRIKFIEVCEKLPVSVYGASMPTLSNAEFDLPWFDMEKRDKQELRKKSRKR